MFFEAFGIFLLILLIVISWRVVDSIMQAPGTSASLPLVSTPPAIATTGTGPIVAGGVSQTNFTMPDMSSYYGSYFPAGTTSTTPTVVPAGTPLAASTTAPVPGATTTPSALPPPVITPPSPADLQASMGLSGLSMPAVDMSKYYPTSLARTPAPVSPAPLPAVVPPPVVSAPAPLVVAPAVAPVVPAPAPQAVAPTTLTYVDTMLGTYRTKVEGIITKLTGILPNTCGAGQKFNGSTCEAGSSTGAPVTYMARCPSGYTSGWNAAADKSLCYPDCPSGTKQVNVGECRSCPAGTEDNGYDCYSQCPAGTITEGRICTPSNAVPLSTTTPICPTGFKPFSDHGSQLCVDSKLNAAKTGVTCPAGGGLVTTPNMQLCGVCPSGMTKISKDGYCMA